MQTTFIGICFIVAAVGTWAQTPASTSGLARSANEPLFQTVDLNIDESQEVPLANGKVVKLKLIDLKEFRCAQRGAVRRAEVTVEIDGQREKLIAATYNLPVTTGPVQIDCPVTRGYTVGSSEGNIWALDKDVRLRVWPAGSPWFKPGAFGYPVNQRWFASDTQMANDPCYVDGGDLPGQKTVYYHYGLDFGGAEGMVDALAATDGVLVCRGDERMAGIEYPPQVKPRYDVLYIRDDNGWYYRYSHLKSFETAVKLGQRVLKGTQLGTLGKEGGSGGWSHLHLDITMPQPSGRYGIADGYAFIFQAYRERHYPRMIAVARPHQVAWTGADVTLDASRSWHAEGAEHIRQFEWQLSDGTIAKGQTTVRRYARPGHYTEVLKVIDDQGESTYDFAVVQVFNQVAPRPFPPSIHAVCWPTMGNKAGDPITFKVRTFGVRPDEGEEIWDFADGTASVRTRSDGNANQHAINGYAITTHRFAQPGDYLVNVRRANDRGESATGRLFLRIEPK